MFSSSQQTTPECVPGCVKRNIRSCLLKIRRLHCVIEGVSSGSVAGLEDGGLSEDVEDVGGGGNVDQDPPDGEHEGEEGESSADSVSEEERGERRLGEPGPAVHVADTVGGQHQQRDPGCADVLQHGAHQQVSLLGQY